MPIKRYTPEQIIHKLREDEVLLSQGKTTAEASRQIGVVQQNCSLGYRPPAPEAILPAEQLIVLSRVN